MQPVNSYSGNLSIEDFAMALAVGCDRRCRLLATYKLKTVTNDIFLVMREVAAGDNYPSLRSLTSQSEEFLKKASVYEQKNLDDPKASDEDKKVYGNMKLVLKIQVFEGNLNQWTKDGDLSKSFKIKNVKLIFDTNVLGDYKLSLSYEKNVVEEKIKEESLSKGEKKTTVKNFEPRKYSICQNIASLPLNLQDENRTAELQAFWKKVQKLNWTNYAIIHEIPEDQFKEDQFKKISRKKA